ncbi:MAG TPA: GNAT family N-acetyltransferase [Gemmatimonadales bacterium]|nr:GNAT family N-acetyltransferase [Gemmatimonadales bacterium]
MPIPMTPGLVAELERAELRAWSDFYNAAPSPAVVACGLGLQEYGTAAAFRMSKVDVMVFNRVLGLGLDGPPSPSTLESIIAGYEQALVPRFHLQLAPLVTLGPTMTAVTDLGFAPGSNWVRLVRDVGSPGPVPTKFRIEIVDRARAPLFAEVVCTGFGMDESLALPVQAVVGTPGWHCYLAYDGDRPIASAVLVVDGRVGWMGFATTLPEARGKGAQSSLIARRILDARTLGCELLSVETDEQTPAREAPSYRNILRAGFEVGYLRPNYLYKFQQRDGA